MPYVRFHGSHLNIYCISFLSSITFSFDGEVYREIDMKSRYEHHWTLGLANYKGIALTTGCNSFGACSFKTELLYITTERWYDGPDFPYGDRDK